MGILRKACGILACLVVLPLLAQAPPATPAAGKALFWRATRDGQTVYLLGSIHVADKSMYPMPAEVEAAFAASDELMVEANINRVDREALTKTVAEKGMYPAGDSLSRHLDAEGKKALDEACRSLGIPAAEVEQMRPWMAMAMLGEAALQNQGMDPALGIDKHFLDEAEKEHKKIAELESIDFQLKLLAGLPEEVIIKSFPRTMNDIGQTKTLVADMKEAWKTGDAAKTAQLINNGLNDEPAIRKVLLDDRNVDMAARMEKAAGGKKAVFVVVGAGHMVGERGLVTLLRKDGWVVEQPAVTRGEGK